MPFVRLANDFDRSACCCLPQANVTHILEKELIFFLESIHGSALFGQEASFRGDSSLPLGEVVQQKLRWRFLEQNILPRLMLS